MFDKHIQTYQLQIKPVEPEKYEKDVSSTSSTSTVFVLGDEVNKYLDRRESLNFRAYPGAERETYDYNTERYGIHKTSILESIAHLIKGSIGVGALTMHEAFMHGGIWTSLVATCLLGVLNSYIMYMLVSSAQIMYGRLRVSKLTYPDLAEVAAATSTWRAVRKYKKHFRYVVEFSLVLLMCGTCCIYQIMIAQTLKQIVPNWIDNIRMCIVFSAPVLLWMCVIRSLKFLAPFALMADIFIGMSVLATLYYSLQTGENISNRPAWKSFHDLLKFCGICIYTTSGIAVCLPIENHMNKPSYFSYALMWATVVEIILTASTGFFGYWGWGETCTSPITIHMPPNVLTTILQFLMYIMLCITFVLQYWVPFRIIWHYISRKHKRTRQRWLVCYERIYRILFAGVITGVSILFPNLLRVMAFIGLFVLGFIAFVFPALIESLITWEYDKSRNIRWRLPKNIILIVFGLILTGNAFATTFTWYAT